MKIYTEPNVILIAKPQIYWSGIREYLSRQGCENGWTELPKLSPETLRKDFESGSLIPEFCGRMCYQSFGNKQGRKTNQEYITNIIESGHGSILEHANWTFLVTQASRGFTHEMVRHRAGFAYSQESTHFIDYTKEENWSLCLDPNIGHSESLEMQLTAMRSYRTYGIIYKGLIEKGYKKKEACSMARQELPIGMESKLAFTANARALRHFIENRCNAHNVSEIRKVALKVLEILKKEAPAIFNDFKVYYSYQDNSYTAISSKRKI